ncbi:P-loop containing nucleoside triphosphate hydrolase protein [Ascodesmis nigricans]|uniref:ATP-dependent RNA helicase ROK1 n=1 Tax=Ascodesmis nigricans TaxID=341454 RepID=A0A4S2N130_9PEZI|nr:P-loop containing nucleoside triphosphate hydrolase protein [Ascodesmis nigricans]
MTDVFRLLTRSTTLKKRPLESVISAPVLPSTTKQANPAPNKKRKKSTTENAATSTAALPREIDFFGMSAHAGTAIAATNKSAHEEPALDDSDAESQSSDEEDGEAQGGAVLPPTPEEIKSTLRQHKLKFTFLNGLETPAVAEPPKKKKKKSSKIAEAEKAKKKKEKRPELLVPPLTDFADLRTKYKLSKRVYANILAQGYLTPTEVQMGALPVFMNRELELEGVEKDSPIDLITCAPTGSGKTLAYIVPVLNQLLAQKTTDKTKGVRAVILAPTKELVGQIVYETKKLAKGTGLKVSQMKKGSQPMSATAAAAGASSDSTSTEPVIKSDILVSTPLVLLHALESAPTLMTGIQHLVLDEADVLLDELFRTQTLGVWRQLRSTSPSLRASLWSATISSSTEQLAITELSLTAPPPSILRLIVGIKDTSLPTIKQTLTYTATEPGKLLALRQLFTSSLRPPILIFLQNIQRAQALYNEILYDLPTPGRIAVLHAELTDAQREDTMRRFRLGEIWVLITTDLLARGIDFHGVQMVVNYDIPTSVAAYIHRVGRTGRAGRQGGEAMTYYTKEDIGYVKGIATVIEKGTGGVQKWLLDVLPKTGKREKQRLKKRGVEARKVVKKEEDEKMDKKNRISTKSGWQRKVEERKRAAVEASKRRKKGEEEGDESGGEGGEE